MKLKNVLIVCSVMSLITSAWACPDLSGEWTCESQDGTTLVEVTQNGFNYHIVSNDGTTSDITADGVTRDNVLEGQDENGNPVSIAVKETATCSEVTVNLHQQNTPTPEFPYVFTIDSAWTKVGDRQVNGQFNFTMMGRSEISSTTCYKN